MKTDMSGAAAVDRRDVGAEGARREDARHRLRAAGREHAERHRDPPRRRAARSATARRSRCSTPTPRAGSSSPTRCRSPREDGADAIVDLATLTGACVVALGEKIAGLMANNDGWAEQVRAAADRAGEPRVAAAAAQGVPQDDRLRDRGHQERELGRLRRRADRGSVPAGVRRRRRPWTHLDIAGPARAGSDDGYLVRGGTGFGVRTLVELVESFEAPARDDGHSKGRGGASGSGRGGRARKRLRRRRRRRRR